MFKLVAFTICKNEVVNTLAGRFPKLRFSIKRHLGFNIAIWFTGSDELPDENEFYFAYPTTKSLLDRNLIVRLSDDEVTIENDWLGSIPVFYNEENLTVSTLCNHCVLDKKLNHEALTYFLDSGFSLFNQTPISGVRFMRYYSKLSLTATSLRELQKDDPILEPGLFKRKHDPKETLDLIQKYICERESKVEKNIIIPTSGGYDSRLLNAMISDKSRISAVTYGYSTNQKRSFETVRAKKLCEILGITWEQIELHNSNDFIYYWFDLFGFSTHLHGMYGMDFIDSLSEKFYHKPSSLLSGIVGDAWSGKHRPPEINQVDDLDNLYLSHGLSFQFKFDKCQELKAKEEFFYLYRESLQQHEIRLIFLIRFKLILLSYLTKVPEFYGINTWTPFLSFDNVISMLNIELEKWTNRKWQVDFFKQHGIYLEQMHLGGSRENSLYLTSAHNTSFEDIDPSYFNGYIEKNTIDRINNELDSIDSSTKIREYFLSTLKFNSVRRRIGFKEIGLKKTLHSYYVIKALELALK